jgi:hypothetical protein
MVAGVHRTMSTLKKKEILRLEQLIRDAERSIEEAKKILRELKRSTNEDIRH